MDIDDLDEEEFKQGGSIQNTVGYIAGYDKDKILLVSELDHDGDPNRGFNIIPITVVKRIKLIKANQFKYWGGVLPKKDKDGN
jgi:hypothetical protein